MAKRLNSRNTTKKKQEKEVLPTKLATEVKVGEEITIKDLSFVVYQMDVLEDKLCFVDKYACDYYVSKNEKVEIGKRKNKAVQLEEEEE